MKSFFCNIRFIGVLCCVFQSFQSQAQIKIERYSYNMRLEKSIVKPNRILSKNSFPWNVCLAESNYTRQEKEWTRIAMQRWHRQFKEFLKREPG